MSLIVVISKVDLKKIKEGINQVVQEVKLANKKISWAHKEVWKEKKECKGDKIKTKWDGKYKPNYISNYIIFKWTKCTK